MIVFWVSCVNDCVSLFLFSFECRVFYFWVIAPFLIAGAWVFHLSIFALVVFALEVDCFVLFVGAYFLCSGYFVLWFWLIVVGVVFFALREFLIFQIFQIALIVFLLCYRLFVLRGQFVYCLVLVSVSCCVDGLKVSLVFAVWVWSL